MSRNNPIPRSDWECDGMSSSKNPNSSGRTHNTDSSACSGVRRARWSRWDKCASGQRLEAATLETAAANAGFFRNSSVVIMPVSGRREKYQEQLDAPLPCASLFDCATRRVHITSARQERTEDERKNQLRCGGGQRGVVFRLRGGMVYGAFQALGRR